MTIHRSYIKTNGCLPAKKFRRFLEITCIYHVTYEEVLWWANMRQLQDGWATRSLSFTGHIKRILRSTLKEDFSPIRLRWNKVEVIYHPLFHQVLSRYWVNIALFIHQGLKLASQFFNYHQSGWILKTCVIWISPNSAPHFVLQSYWKIHRQWSHTVCHPIQIKIYLKFTMCNLFIF